MIFDTVPVEPIGTNCCLIGDEAANVCAFVDPGAQRPGAENGAADPRPL